MNTPQSHGELRDAVRALCAQFPDEYHRKVDARRGYPEAFVDALTKAGWMAALIPQEYGGSGLGLTEASVIMEEINRSGGNSGACHGQMYNMGTLLRHGSPEQKQRYLPRIASGELRLQSMGVTEPTTGTDTTKIKTTAVQQGRPLRRQRPEGLDLARAALRPDDPAGAHHAAGRGGKKKSKACRSSSSTCTRRSAHGMTVRPIANMVNHETNELFFENLEIPAENLIGEEGQGFKYILDGLNAERTLIAAECIGDGYWFIDRVTAYVKDRVVFGRPIGQNQGVQFPIAEAYIEVEAADLMRYEGVRAVRRAPALRRAGQHGQVPRRQGELGGGQRLPAVPRRLRLRLRIRRRAQVPRDAAVPGGADLDQPDPELRGRARARIAAVFLSRDSARSMASPCSRSSTSIAAPFCTRQLADLGARVIKIERPGGGDLARGYDQRVRGLSSHFVWTNRSKESLTLDVKHPQARRDPAAPARAQADVLVQNLAPGAAARMGLSFEALHATLPEADRLRHLGLWRRRERPGPYRDKKAYDLLIQSESGFLSITGTPDEPAKAGCSIADIAAGMYALQQHPGGADRARPHRPRLPHRRVDAREHGRVDELSAVLRLSRAPRRRRAPARRTPPSIPTARSPPATARW